MIRSHVDPSSFRDPSGFVYKKDQTLYRQVNTSYKHEYDYFKKNLYEDLLGNSLIVPFEEAPMNKAYDKHAYKILKPNVIPFISYPYEWGFSQLKDAALATLEINKLALKKGMVLKDASAYNIQFYKKTPKLMDTLSFDMYKDGTPWIAYRQFCQHFLAPLALMKYSDARLSQLLKIHMDGVPLDLASKLLPTRTRLNPKILMHIHAHTLAQSHAPNKPAKTAKQTLKKTDLERLLKNLGSAVKSLNPPHNKTEWGDYEEEHNYSDAAYSNKLEITESWMKDIKAKTVWDLGGNAGYFSGQFSDDTLIILMDKDYEAVEKAYTTNKGQKNLLPLVVDLANPSPFLGWNNEERRSLIDRGPADLVLALALIHHLRLSENIPLDKIASFFAQICGYCIVEFVPKDDPQAQRLLVTREDIFDDYNKTSFKKIFSKRFDIIGEQKIADSDRVLYLLKNEGHEKQNN